MPDPAPSLTPESIAAAVEAAIVALAPRLAQRVAAELSVRSRPIHQVDPSALVLATVRASRYRGVTKSNLLRKYRTIRASEMDPIIESLASEIVFRGRRYYGAAYVPPVMDGAAFQPAIPPCS